MEGEDFNGVSNSGKDPAGPAPDLRHGGPREGDEQHPVTGNSPLQRAVPGQLATGSPQCRGRLPDPGTAEHKDRPCIMVGDSALLRRQILKGDGHGGTALKVE